MIEKSQCFSIAFPIARSVQMDMCLSVYSVLCELQSEHVGWLFGKGRLYRECILSATTSFVRQCYIAPGIVEMG